VCTTKNKMLIGIKYNNNNNKKKTLIISIRILIRLAFKKKNLEWNIYDDLVLNTTLI
jgi:hypothetical protein